MHFFFDWVLCGIHEYFSHTTACSIAYRGQTGQQPGQNFLTTAGEELSVKKLDLNSSRSLIALR